MTKRKLLGWIPGSMRAFRAEKRKEARKALKEAHTLLLGSAYTPAQEEISDAYFKLAEIVKRLSVKQWGK